MMRFVVRKIGRPQNCCGTRSRAYSNVKGRSLASETRAMSRRLPSTASLTVAIVQRGATSSV